jgi:hypothetical protein
MIGNLFGRFGPGSVKARGQHVALWLSVALRIRLDINVQLCLRNYQQEKLVSDNF